MTDEPLDASGLRPLRPWLKFSVILLMVVAGAVVVWIVGRSGNAAQSAADWIPAFAAESGAITYCGNGYGTGIDNDVPWWEWTLLADGTPSAFADDLLPALRINGFDVASSPGSPAEYGEFSTLNNPDHLASIGWATSWIRIDGSNTAGISVLARVADATTRNNCFPKAGDVAADADPADADVIAVIMFRDTGD